MADSFVDYTGGGDSISEGGSGDLFTSLTSNISRNANGSNKNGTVNNDSLWIALAGDATKIGTAFIAADAAKSTVKNTAKSPQAIYLVAGAVLIAGIIAVVLLKK